MIKVIEYNTKTKRLTEKNIKAKEKFSLKRSSFYWFDVVDPVEEDYQFLESGLKFHHLLVEDLHENFQRPKVLEFDNTLFLAFHKVLMNGETKFQQKEVDFVLHSQYLLTFSRDESHAINRTRRLILGGSKILHNGPDYVMYTILDLMVDHCLENLNDFEEHFNALEKRIMKDPQCKNSLKHLNAMKMNLHKLGRIITPQLDIILGFSRGVHPLISKKLKIYFSDIFDHLYKSRELMDGYKEQVSSAVGMHLGMLSNRMNEIMKILTLFASIFMPLTLISGIYGMNFKYMPELVQPYGYYGALGLMVLVAGGLIWYFKRKGWF